MPRREGNWLKGSPALFFLLLTAVQPWGLLVGLGFALITVTCAFVWIRHLQRQAAKDFHIRSAKERLLLLSRLRHDWLNHIQVILGYLTMKREREIAPYLRKLSDQAQDERAVARAGYPPLAFLLAILNQSVPEWRWVITSPEEIETVDRIWGERLCQWMEGMVPSLQAWGRYLDEPEEVWLTLQKQGDRWVIHVVPDWPGNAMPSSSEWQVLRNTMEQLGSSLEERSSEEGAFSCTLKDDRGKSERGGTMNVRR